MRIEVLIGNDDPIIFPLNSSKMTLGSSEHCDIIIDADGVSRKHITFISEGDNYFVVDQGSTNGSFINEERLIPGRKTEFTSFFPVRLGDNVLISLLSDDEDLESDVRIDFPKSAETSSPNPKPSRQSDHDSTSVISLAELKKVKTEHLILQRDEKRAARRKNKPVEKKKPKKKLNYMSYFIVFMILGAGFYNYKNRARVEEVRVAEVGQIVESQTPVAETPVSQPEEVPSLLVPDSDLVNKQSYETLLNDLKCTTDIEIYLCDFFPTARSDRLGAVQVGLTLHVLLDGSDYFDEAKKFSKKPLDNSPASLEEYNNLVHDTGIYLYLMRMDHGLDIERLKDLDLSLAFMQQTDNGYVLARVMAIKPNAFPQLRTAVTEENLRFIKSNGSSALVVTKDLYRTY